MRATLWAGESAGLKENQFSPKPNLGRFVRSYTDAKITEYIDDDGVDQTDLRMKSYTPKNTVNVGMRYSFAPMEWGNLSARLDYRYIDEMGTSALKANFERGRVPSRWSLDTRVMLKEIPVGDTGTMEVSAWAKNLTDERNVINKIDFGSAIGIVNAQYAAPRSFGVDVSYNF